jgi:hypothetical protein
MIDKRPNINHEWGVSSMKKISMSIIALAMVLCIVVPVSASFHTGSPSPSLSPVFGTLVNFDDKSAGTTVAPNDYASVGVASIVETEGIAPLVRHAGSQSLPNYIGTDTVGERGGDSDSAGWDGTLEITLAHPANMVGIGIANSIGDAEVITIKDASGAILEQQNVPRGSNVYVYFERDNYDIKTLTVTGDWFALDDLQFNSAIPSPEFPSTFIPITMIIGFLGAVMYIQRSREH